jgi:transposase
MKSKQILIDTFKHIISEGNIFHQDNPNRKLDEVSYFEAYLHFLNNSIYYSRFSHTINGVTIKGKYLNEKVTKWANFLIFEKIHEKILTDYVNSDQLSKNIVSIDSQFIRNRFMSSKSKIIGRNKYYKNKKGTKLTVIVDNKGAPLTLSVDNGCKHDSKILINECMKLLKTIDIKREDNISLLADSGYDSHANKEFLKSKRIIPVIKWNKKNTKNPKIIKRNKFTKKQKKIYNKRIVVENFFSWKDLIIPRSDKIYDRKIQNFIGMLLIMASIIILKKCVYKKNL